VLLTLLSLHFSSIASTASGSLSGRVHGSTNTTPLIAAVIHIEGTTLKAKSNLQGEYSFSAIPPGTYTVRAEISGFAPEIIRSVRIRENKPATQDIIFTTRQQGLSSRCDSCAAPSVILGKVTDNENQPVAEVAVTLLGLPFTTTSGNDGLFSFTALPDGAYNLTLSHPQFKADTIRNLAVEQGVVQDIILVLRPLKSRSELTGILRGKIADSATAVAVPKASVSLLNTDYTTLTDENGEYQLSMIPPATYSLLITRWGYEALVLSGITIDTARTTLHNASLAARGAGAFSADGPLGSISGVISDARGEAVPNAQVWLRDTERRGYSNMVGHYQIDSVPSGVYQLMSTAEGFDTAVSADSDIWSGEMTMLNLALSQRAQGVKVGDVALEQGKGALSGVVLDGKSSEALAGVTVQLSELKSAKAVTDLQGRYTLANVKPGTYTITVAHNGFVNATQSVTIREAEVSRGDFLLNPSEETQMTRMSIRSVRIANTGAALLKERQQAVSFTDAIGSQEMSRGGASNAAEAIKIVTGVTLEDDKYVIVRGMPKRYTTTMLNGAILPSPDPNTKAVNMDLFPSDMIENITVYKTFTPQLPGDWAGGVVDIKSKPFPDKLKLSVAVSGSYVDGTTLNDSFLTYDGGKLDWLAVDDGTRALPKIFEKYTKEEIDIFTSYQHYPLNSPLILSRLNDPSDPLADSLKIYSDMINALDNRPMSPEQSRALPNLSFSAALGNTLALASGKLGFRLGLNYSNGYDLSIDGYKADYSGAFSEYSNSPASPPPDKVLSESKSNHKVDWGILGTLAYEWHNGNHIEADYINIQNANDEVKLYSGKYPYFLTDATTDIYTTQQIHYTQRSLQYFHPVFKGILQAGYTPLHISAQGSLTRTELDEPDLRDFQYNIEPRDSLGTWYKIHTNYPEPSHKFRTLSEMAYSAHTTISIPFYQWADDSSTVSFGGGWDFKQRTVRERRFEYMAKNYTYNQARRYSNPEIFFTPHNTGLLPDTTTASGYSWGITLQDLSENVSQWDGSQNVIAAFLMSELPLGGPFSLTSGIRWEWTAMDGESIFEKEYDRTHMQLNQHDFLPALLLTTKLRESMNLRLSFSRTLARPMLREMAEYPTSSFTGGTSFIGNKGLKNSSIYNFDARWEWFIRPGELLAISPFYKIINKPIEYRFLAAGQYLQPINTKGSSRIGGMEFEVRKQLDFTQALRRFQFAGNITASFSEVDLSKEDESMRKLKNYFPNESETRPFQGQSPLVLNFLLTYDNPDIGTNCNILYNFFWQRLDELTPPNVPWLWQKSSGLLNLTARQKISEQWELKLKVKDILNSIATTSWGEKNDLANKLNTRRSYVHYYKDSELTTYSEDPGWSISLGIEYTF
jgi:protocatechuate 3,4-dioxygenase beta subunit